jgi:hypothetical protein
MNGGPEVAIDQANRLVAILLIALSICRDNDDFPIIEQASAEPERDAMFGEVRGIFLAVEFAFHDVLYVFYI